MRRSIGLLSSIASTLDAFFPEWIELWQTSDVAVHTAANGTTQLINPTSHTHIRALNQRPNVRSAIAMMEIRRWIEQTQVECLLTNTATASAVSRLAYLRIPIVYFCHGLVDARETPRIVSKTYQIAERILCRRTDAVIVMNESDERWFAARFGGPILRLRAGVGLNVSDWLPARLEHERLTQAKNLNHESDRTFKVVWMGSLADRKRPFDAIRIAHELSFVTTGLQLIMAGDGPLRIKCEQLAHELGIADIVSFPGHVDPKVLLPKADAFLHTAEREGFCRSLLEASYIGLPCIGYEVKGVVDLPTVFARGLPGDTSALASTLLKVFHNKGPDGPARPENSLEVSSASAWQEVNHFLKQIMAGNYG